MAPTEAVDQYTGEYTWTDNSYTGDYGYYADDGSYVYG